MVVTGANRGLGLETSHQLAGRGIQGGSTAATRPKGKQQGSASKLGIGGALPSARRDRSGQRGGVGGHLATGRRAHRRSHQQRRRRAGGIRRRRSSPYPRGQLLWGNNGRRSSASFADAPWAHRHGLQRHKTTGRTTALRDQFLDLALTCDGLMNLLNHSLVTWKRIGSQTGLAHQRLPHLQGGAQRTHPNATYLIAFLTY